MTEIVIRMVDKKEMLNKLTNWFVRIRGDILNQYLYQENDIRKKIIKPVEKRLICQNII